jgi:hypothetical protein
MSLGVNLGSPTKVLKSANDDVMFVIKAGDDTDVLNLTYEVKGKSLVVGFCTTFVWASSAKLPTVSVLHRMSVLLLLTCRF